jgi:hypothetical protein
MPRRTLFVMRWLGALVFAVAAGSAVLAGSGLAVPPHTHAPGTPLYHDHLLAAYRYPLFLLRLQALAHPAAGPSWTLDDGAASTALGGMVLGLLAAFVPRLPRPGRRPVAELAAPLVAPPQWRPARIHGPPRLALLAA